MINSDKNILIQETEVKPNLYVSVVFSVTLVAIVISWVLNEIGIFRVGTVEMRIGSGIPLVAILFPLVGFMVNSGWLSNPKSKYFVIATSIIVTASVTTLMTFHTTIMLLYPIFIAMMYRSTGVGKVALFGSLLCTIFSPILGYVLGAWDIELFKELILIGTNGTAVIQGAYPAITAISIAKIVLYIVLPHMLLVGSCAVLMFYVIKLGAKHVENLVTLNRLSHRDALTGLYNRNFFDSCLNIKEKKIPVGVIFFDVNGLKQLNDAKGHEYGDLLLKRCAQSIADICVTDDDSGFRLGGDEFLYVMENATREKILAKLAQWQEALERVNEENKTGYEGIVCSMAAGYALGSINDLQNLVRRADAMMYRNKTAYKAEKAGEK